MKPAPVSSPWAALILAFGTLLALAAQSARAAIFTVTNIDDSGPGSLRQAVLDANALAGDDTIDFAPALDGQTITLTSGQLTVFSNIAIDASALGNGLTISGNHASRIFEIPAGGQTVSLSGLTLIRGFATGGGSLDDRGAIHNSGGTVNIIYCNLANNAATDDGGGIYLTGTGSVVTLTSSTLSNNTASSDGGGIYVASGGVARLANATLVGNTSMGSGGGIFVSIGGFAPLVNTTLVGNSATNSGGGIYLGGLGAASVQNSIIAGNAASSGPNLRLQMTVSFSWTGANLIGDNSTVENSFAFDGILIGNSANPVNPHLAPLANYGGPTDTMPPLPGSPAIDAAITLPSTPATDQRGAPRPTGAAPDLGAVEEFQPGGFTDTDLDGMHDDLEPLYGFVVGTQDGHLDADGDLSSNADELANRTDPHDASDSFHVLEIAPAPGFDLFTNPVFDVTWSSYPGLSYSIECDAALDFGAPATLGPFTPAGFTETRAISLLPGSRDYLRVRRN